MTPKPEKRYGTPPRYAIDIELKDGELAPFCSYIDDGMRCVQRADKMAYGMIGDDGKKKPPQPMCMTCMWLWLLEQEEFEQMIEDATSPDKLT